MVESMVELLFAFFWGALTLLIIFCIVGSIVAALRAISRERDGGRDEVKENFAFGAEVTVLDDRTIETGIIVMTNPENHYGL
jgi:hypothetical protein